MVTTALLSPLVERQGDPVEVWPFFARRLYRRKEWRMDTVGKLGGGPTIYCPMRVAYMCTTCMATPPLASKLLRRTGRYLWKSWA
eukprot:2675675-Amphidinium_carterae.2